MDLVGGVKHTDNRLDGRKPSHGKGKSAQKSPRIEAVEGEKDQADANHPSAEYDTRLGRKIDTTV